MISTYAVSTANTTPTTRPNKVKSGDRCVIPSRYRPRTTPPATQSAIQIPRPANVKRLGDGLSSTTLESARAAQGEDVVVHRPGPPEVTRRARRRGRLQPWAASYHGHRQGAGNAHHNLRIRPWSAAKRARTSDYLRSARDPGATGGTSPRTAGDVLGAPGCRRPPTRCRFRPARPRPVLRRPARLTLRR